MTYGQHLVFFFDQTMMTEMDTPTTDVEVTRDRPPLDANESFALDQSIASGQYKEKLLYVLALGRIFE